MLCAIINQVASDDHSGGINKGFEPCDQPGKCRADGTMPTWIRVPQRMSPRVGVAVQVLRVARPATPRRPRRLRRRVVRRRGQWAGPRHHTVGRDEAPQPRVIVAGMLLQQARPVQPLASVIQAGLADTAGTDFPPRVERLLAEQRAAAIHGQAHAAAACPEHERRMVAIEIRYSLGRAVAPSDVSSTTTLPASVHHSNISIYSLATISLRPPNREGVIRRWSTSQVGPSPASHLASSVSPSGTNTSVK